MRMRPALVYSHSRKEASNDMTTPASAKQLAAKLRAIEKANPGMKYRALFLSTIGDVAALESDGQVGKFNALRMAIEEMKYPRPLMVDEYAQNNLLDIVLKKLDAAASEGSR